MPTAARGYRPDIDGLRAIAILLVLAFHAWPSSCRGGFVGVDVFFVISGYLITGIIADGVGQRNFRFSQFYGRRIRRLAPSLIVVVAATLFAGFFIEYFREFKRLADTAAATALFAANFVIYRKTGYFDDIAANNPLLHMWSLGVEEQFYLIWPLIIVVTARLRYRHAMTISLYVITVLSLLANVGIARSFPSADFYLLPPRLWEMAVGGLLSIHHLSPRSIAWFQRRGSGGATVQGIAGLALIVAAGWGLKPADTYPGWWAILPVAGSALLIDAGGASWVNRIFLAARPMRFIGLISYQLYLWHWPLLILMWQAGYKGAGPVAGALAAAFLLSFLTQRYIERPFRSRDWSRTIPYRRAVPILASGLVALVAIGLTAPPVQTWQRLRNAPPWVRAMTVYHFDPGADYRVGTCFLDIKQTPAEFVPACVSPPAAAPKQPKLVLLWGDSHAAHLYPGLRKLVDAGALRLAQFNAARCPPILAVAFADTPHCREVNDYVLGRIAALHPDEVILAARWERYGGRKRPRGIAWSALDRTIRRVRELGVGRIVVIGPVPDWENTLPEDLVAYQHQSGSLVAPLRMKDFLNPDASAVEPAIRASAARSGAVYISPLSLLCDDGGCQATLPGADSVTPTAWDNAHLTAAGSIHLVDLMKPDL